MSVTGDLVDKLLSTKLDDIPEDAIEIARQVCLDGIGVMIAALREPLGLGQKAIQYTKSLGGTAESTVIGGGFKSNALNAAYSNGCLAHALDYDNTWWPLNHPTSPTLPAILALSEKYNFSGKDILRTIVLCFEVQGKMRAASLRVMPGSTFHKPGVSGTMGATTAAGLLLGLNREEFLMCYGIAGSRAGSMSANTGTMTKSSHSGHAARMGVESAELAKIGWTASDDIFGKGDFFDLFYGNENCDLELFLKGFGEPYRMIDPGVGFKKHPCNYYTHRPIDATLELVNEHDLKPDEIESVNVDFPIMDYVNRPQPITGLDGKFSVQYATALALIDRRIKVESFSDERRFAPDIEALLPKIHLNMREDITLDFPDTYSIVTVKTKDGRELVARCDKPRGLWGVPLTRDERLAKFRDCVEPAMSKQASEEIIELVEGIDNLADVHPIMERVAQAK
ncbi:MAG: MmgE/PrpD family protein [Rhodospirillales bacterium]|jgi:2-methylcitrate dehydratase PrpD